MKMIKTLALSIILFLNFGAFANTLKVIPLDFSVPSKICQGMAVTFTPNKSVNSFIEWYIDGVMQDGYYDDASPSLLYAFDSSGDHEIRLETATEIVTKIVTVLAVPSIQASSSSICNSANISLTVTNPTTDTYTWSSIPSGFSGTGTSVNFTVTQSVNFNVASSNGCSSAAPLLVTVYNTLIQPVLDPQTPYHKRIIRGNSSSSAAEHYWQTSAGGTATTKNLQGDYTVTQESDFYVRRQNNGGNCWTTASGPIHTTMNYAPDKPLVLQLKKSGGNEILFNNDSKAHLLTFADYYWVSDASANPTIVGQYIVNNQIVQGRLTSSGTHYLKGRDRGTGTWGETLTINVTLRDDDGYNWIHTKSFDGKASEQIVSESKSYFDDRGQPLQSQSKNLERNRIFTTQSLIDKYDRIVGESLPAPIAQSNFTYNGEMLLNEDGSLYTNSDFDAPLIKYNAKPVGQSQPGTVGWYYSANNTLEQHVPVTSYPYSRREYYEDGTGEVMRSAGAGNVHRLGMGHEELSGTFPVHSALADYLKRRLVAVPGITQDNSLFNEGVQTILRDENGKYVISIADKSGKVVMTARNGSPIDSVLRVNNVVVASANESSPNYRKMTYFYILNSQPVSITVTGAPANSLYGGVIQKSSYSTSQSVYIASQEIRLQPGFSVIGGNTFSGSIAAAGEGWAVENIVTGEVLPPYQTFADVNGNWPIGFYRLIMITGEATLSYTNYYLDVAYQFYDDMGRLKSAVSPNGFKKWKEVANPAASYSIVDKTTYTYNFRGWMLSMTETDAGTTNYKYRKDGKIRFSQNAQQKIDSVFSYAHYDNLDRPIETGEFRGTKHKFANLASQLEFSQQKIYSVDSVKDWVKTYYDFADANSGLPAGMSQDFVVGKVSYTENANMKTWYSYNELGRVTWMAQKPKGLSRVFVSKYEYDFLGNFLTKSTLSFEGEQMMEEFYHHYEYDKDKRLVRAFTSTDGVTKMLRASYKYYLHGPLKRVELGGRLQGTDVVGEVQGIDFVYNINGWLTQINDPNQGNDPGGDANDAFGMIHDYYESEMAGLFPGTAAQYTGLIAATRWKTKEAYGTNQGDLSGMYKYSYDKKDQIQQAEWLTPNHTANTFAAAGNKFKITNLTYDPNGNIQSMNRFDQAGTMTNNFVYNYDVNSNKLRTVSGYVNTDGFSYNAIGQMTGVDKVTGEDQYVNYDVAGKVVKVFDAPGKTQTDLKVEYIYDDRGFRLAKKNFDASGVITLTTWYIRDGSGNIISIYEQQSGQGIIQTEIPLYGSGKLATIYPQQDASAAYEVTDHLGNVRALVRDNSAVYTATMEDTGIAAVTNPRVQEIAYFENIFETEVTDVNMNHTPNTATIVANPSKSAYLYWVSGTPGMDAVNKATGPAIALKVNPGDTIKAEAYVRYRNETSFTRSGFTLSLLSTLLGNSFNLASGFEGSTLAQTTQSFSDALTSGAFLSDGTDDTRPYAYLNYIVLDANHNRVSSGWQRVTDAAEFFAGEEGLPNMHEKIKLSSSVIVGSTGKYVYVWVSNESQGARVWFDDVTVTHTGSYIAQATDYGVWGDVLVEQMSVLENKYRFGYQGQFAEKDEETGWNHFELREYDPVIGRWTTKDPAGQFYSPYVGMGNNPISGVDADGAIVKYQGNFFFKAAAWVTFKLLKIISPSTRMKIKNLEDSPFLFNVKKATVIGNTRVASNSFEVDDKNGTGCGADINLNFSLKFRKQYKAIVKLEGSSLGRWILMRVVGHELTHADDIENGVIDRSRNAQGVKNSEVKAVKAENKLVKELKLFDFKMDKRYRKKYSGSTILQTDYTP